MRHLAFLHRPLGLRKRESSSKELLLVGYDDGEADLTPTRAVPVTYDNPPPDARSEYEVAEDKAVDDWWECYRKNVGVGGIAVEIEEARLVCKVAYRAAVKAVESSTAYHRA